MIFRPVWFHKFLALLLPLTSYIQKTNRILLEKWLVETERHYGGPVKSVRRRKVSPKDPRPHKIVKTIEMQGGDRMRIHGYAGKYAEYLSPIFENYAFKGYPITIVEIGVLKGTGLAIWGDLFPRARLIGLDLDLFYIQKNMRFLKKHGAFKIRRPELYEFDQFDDNSRFVSKLLRGDRIDICIDDGTHQTEANLRTFASIHPLLSERFVYFIEDNHEIYKKICKFYPDIIVENSGELTIITPQAAKS